MTTLSLKAQIYELFQPQTYVNDAGQKLLYRLLEPETTKKGEKYPVIIFLHGSGERGDDNERQLTWVMHRFVNRNMRAKYPCYIIAPQCPKDERWTSWSWKDEVINWDAPFDPKQEMIMEIVDKLIKKKAVDPNRVYIGGLSMGGMGTWDMLTHYPDRFAAAFPICGIGNAGSAEKIKHIPIWAFHGADDGVVPPSGSRDVIKAIREAGGKPIYTEFEGVKHDSWLNAFDENPFVYDWLFSQRKK